METNSTTSESEEWMDSPLLSSSLSENSIGAGREEEPAATADEGGTAADDVEGAGAEATQAGGGSAP
jgi:hypothetical protein